MPNILENYTPADLGLDGYAAYRSDPVTGQPVQLEVIEFAGYCEKRFAAAAAPTGIGKSLVAMSLAKLTGARTCILTATKGLQEQYVRDGEEYGLVDIRGRSNYECGDYANLDCRGGSSMGCRYVGGKGCGYEIAKAKAKEAELICTNYAFWMTVNDKANGLERAGDDAEWRGENPIEMLILDEGHAAPDLLSDYLSCRVYENEIKRWVDPREMGDKISDWRAFAREHTEDLKAEIRTTGMELAHLGRKAEKKHIDALHGLEKLLVKFERIGTMQEDWVLDLRVGTQWGRLWAFDVIWPGRYAEQYLFHGVPKVVVLSATLRPKTMSLLGVSKDDFEFREWQRIFPANRHPIYSLPARDDGKEIRIKHTTPQAQLLKWVEHIDRIIDGRLDRKGLIQTVSYDRQKFFMEHSRHSAIMIGNTNDAESATALEKAEEFRKSAAPRILVSPSFATGWDFPGRECEYVVICKVPFKPSQGKVQKAREAKDAQYGLYMTMIELVQGAGRGMRSAEDRCEVFVTDGNLTWFLNQNKSLAPAWFVQGLRKVVEIPKAPERVKK